MFKISKLKEICCGSSYILVCSLKSGFKSRSTDSELRPIQIYAFKKMSPSVSINKEYILHRKYLQVEITRYNNIIVRMILSSVFDRKRMICKCLLLSMIGYCLCCCGFCFACIVDGFASMCQFTYIISHENKMGIVYFLMPREKTTLKLTKTL